MRFFWLALTIVGPIVFVHAMEAELNEKIQLTYFFTAIAFFIVSTGLTVSEFVKHRNKERHADDRILLQQRDDDIAKWRRAFIEETSDLYNAQKTMLTKAQELGEHHANYIRASSRNNKAIVDEPTNVT